MLVRSNIKLLVVIILALTAAGCSDFGEVEQGIVVSSDGTRLTLVLDSNPGDAVYDRVPPVVVTIPEDESQMGPMPEAGGLIALDTAANQAVIYNPAGKDLLTVSFEMVELTSDVYPDDQRVIDAGAPKVDSAAGTVTLYAPRTRELATIKVPAEHLSLPAATWQAGDEVRYYFKDPTRALRLMNISKSNIR
jgi:hypothetical protein